MCVDEAKGRVPVIAGAGSNNTGRGDRPRTARREGGRRRGSRRHALLQQADPGRALPALQGDQRRGRHPDHHLQHPAALGHRHVGRDDGAALRAQEHRRREGRDRQHRPRLAAAPCHGAGVHPALGRGHDGARLQRAWRQRLHLGRRERRAAALRRAAGDEPRRRLCRRLEGAGPPRAAARRDLRRAGPRRREVRPRRCSAAAARRSGCRCCR